MIETTPPPNERPAAEGGLSSHLLSLLASLAGYFRARMELAGIEGKDAAALYIKGAVILVIALGLLAFGYALLWVGIIALFATVFHFHWGWCVVVIGLLHLVGAFLGLLAVLRLWKQPVFTATLEEFRKDQEWLNRHK